MKKKWRKVLSMLMSLCLIVGMMSTSVWAVGDDVVARIGETEYTSLEEAVDEANQTSGAVIDVVKSCTVDSLLEIKSAMTIQGQEGVVVTVAPEANRINTGEIYGFKMGTAIENGTVTFKDLTIKGSGNNLQLLWVCNTDPKGVSVSVENCKLDNSEKTVSGGYADAISFEYASGDTTDYFNLSVTGCEIAAASYGIGSGLNNGNANVSNCSLTVKDTVFNNTGNSSIYCIHAPVAFGSLMVENCDFNSVNSGGIKYIYNANNEESVVIKNNDFSDCNQNMNSGTYAVMATNQISDLTDDHCYCWATELSGNDFSNQNVIIALKAELEVVWFPDGQAQNDTVYNNMANENITNVGTRYGKSNYGGSTLFKQVGVCLTDFGMDTNEMTFTLGDEGQSTAYFYNTKDASGAYTNYQGAFADYWTDENLRHCSASLATWGEANAITRWNLDGVALTQNAEDSTVYEAENDVAKVQVNTATGAIDVTPKAVGTTSLQAVVGGGENGDLPNAKEDTLTITVEPIPQYTVSIFYLDKETGDVLGTYLSEPADRGTSYDVTDRSTVAFDGYDYDSMDGDVLSGVLDSDKVIYIYYTMKAPESSDEENVEDNDTPTGPAGGENSDVNGGDTTTGDGTTSGDETISDSSTPTGSADDMNTPATGDMTNLIVPMVAVLLSGVLALGMYALRRKMNRS